ncbi:Uncharacterized protein DBV15_04677 [Temnothorax longispinosus]|uniref:Uncharacterized protein n=1 Tax=Temnothorax longispinosus TaxID=300112 RepID=A0A4S2JRV1_9HYME|nr:Uncharacterized protein DBV15_04677 [Temnothorax longispinosus]
MWLTPRSNRAFAGFLHPETRRQKRIAGTEICTWVARAEKWPRVRTPRAKRRDDEKAARKKKDDQDEQERIMCRKGTCLFRACYLPIEWSQEKQLDSKSLLTNSIKRKRMEYLIFHRTFIEMFSAIWDVTT